MVDNIQEAHICTKASWFLIERKLHPHFSLPHSELEMLNIPVSFNSLKTKGLRAQYICVLCALSHTRLCLSLC